MATAIPLWRSHENALRWRSLAERRRAYFAELYKSGRWRHYYTEEAFLAHMREVVRGVEQWNTMVAPPGDKSATPPRGDTARKI
jgi:uncharacterized repeat protein (TIGR03809 family)